MRKCMLCEADMNDGDAVNFLFHTNDERPYLVCEVCGEHIKNMIMKNSKHYEEARDYLNEHTRNCDFFYIDKASRLHL